MTNTTKLIQLVIANINTLINDQVNQILHHDEIQRCESSWRSLSNLTDEVHAQQNRAIIIKMISINMKELAQDLTINHVDFDSSSIFKLIYTDEFDQPGGHPYSIIIGDYYFSHGIREGVDCVSTLAEMSKVAASSFSPFITSADAELVDLENWGKVRPYIKLNKTLNNPTHLRWKKMRSLPEGRFIALVAPRVLIRPAYQYGKHHANNAFFREKIHQHNDSLWGNPAYRYASAIIKSFDESGWFLTIREPIKSHRCPQLSPSLKDTSFNIATPVTEHHITDMCEQNMNDVGLIVPRQHKLSDKIAFYTQLTHHVPQQYDTEQATQSALLSAQVPYILCAARFSQTIKVILRDKVGSYQTAKDCEAELQRWILRYCASSGNTLENSLSQYPLSEASINIAEIGHKPGTYQCITRIKPHCFYNAIDSQLKLSSEIKLTVKPKEAFHDSIS